MAPNHGTTADLSKTELNLLQSAVREGYFKVPREISTIELANRNEMSDRETSQKLRHALDIILRETVLVDER